MVHGTALHFVENVKIKKSPKGEGANDDIDVAKIKVEYDDGTKHTLQLYGDRRKDNGGEFEIEVE